MKWHHGVPSQSEYDQAIIELQTAESSLEDATP